MPDLPPPEACPGRLRRVSREPAARPGGPGIGAGPGAEAAAPLAPGGVRARDPPRRRLRQVSCRAGHTEAGAGGRGLHRLS